jgi:hypothetical protein
MMDDYIKKMVIKHNNKLKWFNYYNKIKSTLDFDLFLNQLILKHDDRYVESCHLKGYCEKPNNIMGCLFEYVFDYGKEVKIKEIDCDFSNVICEFNNYYFQIVFGQGSFFCVYHKNDLKKSIFGI